MRNVTSMIVLAGAFAAAVPMSLDAQRIPQPNVPVEIQVPTGFKPFFRARAVGTQNYICLVDAGTIKWVHLGPQATLFDDQLQQTATHFLSDNPYEVDKKRATWQHSRDTSQVWASALASYDGADYVAPGAVAWLLLEEVGSQSGPTQGTRLTATRYIHRVNTVGGKPPATGCTTPDNLNARQFVPYEADYIFYAAESSR